MVQVDDDRVSRPPPLWPSLVICAVVAIWVDLGTIHRQQHSDSLLYPLISLWCWTPFYWGQDRFGMLVPLMARPITHPLANLLVQDFLNIFSGLAAFILLGALYATRRVVSGRGCAGGRIVPGVGAADLSGDVLHRRLLRHLDGAWPGRPHRRRVAARRGLPPPPRRRPGHDHPGSLGQLRDRIVLGPLAVSRWLFLRAADRDRPFSAHHPADYLARGIRAWPSRAAGSETVVVLALLAVGVAAGRALVRLSSARVPTPLDARATLRVARGVVRSGDQQWESLAPQRLPAFLGCAAVLGMAMLAWPAVR